MTSRGVVNRGLRTADNHPLTIGCTWPVWVQRGHWVVQPTPCGVGTRPEGTGADDFVRKPLSVRELDLRMPRLSVATHLRYAVPPTQGPNGGDTGLDRGTTDIAAELSAGYRPVLYPRLSHLYEHDA